MNRVALILFVYNCFLFQLDNAYNQVVKPLEDFRKKYIGGVKSEKKRFDKQTAKFCQCQERYLNMTTKKTNSLQEVCVLKNKITHFCIVHAFVVCNSSQTYNERAQLK